MKMNKFTYEIVVNVGSYQSIRIGGEWSVTEAPTTEQVLNIDAELRQKVAEVVESRKPASAPQPQPQPKEEEKMENKENKSENKSENKPEPKQAEKPVDNTLELELVPSNSPKFQAILKKIQSGTPEEVVRKYFRFDDRGEQIIAVAYSDLIQEHGKPVEDLKDKLPHKEKEPKVLPKISNQKS